MIIVLETSGKHNSVDTVMVKLFTNRKDAEKYCKENKDDPIDDKIYWQHCEIIDDGNTYEIARYHLFLKYS